MCSFEVVSYVSLINISRVVVDSCDLCTLYLSYCHRLQRTSEFSVYGHGQQRRAIIEAVCLYEEEKKNGSSSSGACESGEGLNGAVSVCPEYAKDISKKWQKYVTQVGNKWRIDILCLLYGLSIGHICCISHNLSLTFNCFYLFLQFRERLLVKLQRSAVRWAMR